jgi:hypothetical protein
LDGCGTASDSGATGTVTPLRASGAALLISICALGALASCQARETGDDGAAKIENTPGSADQSSAWIQQEQHSFAELLAKQQVDVLIAPFQVSGRGLDPAERLLMASRLADQLTASTTLAIADPVIAGRALGEGFRAYDQAAILALAERVGAKHVLIGAAGHDGGRKLHIQLSHLQRDSVSARWRTAAQEQWNDLTLSDEQPPHQMMSALIRQVERRFASAVAARPVASVSLQEPGSLPALKDVVAAPSAQPINVHVAQLLASCFPRSPEAAHERAWIQTLRLVSRASAASDHRLATARALLHLGRRPAALAALGEPRSSAERALREAANGNLPAASAQTAKITDPVLRLLAEIELRDLRLAYGAANEQLAARNLPALLPEEADWFPFLYTRMEGEGSAWGVEHVLQALTRFESVLGTDHQLIPGLLENLMARVPGSENYENATVDIARTGFASYAALVDAEPAPARDRPALMRALLLDLYQTQIAADLLADIRMKLHSQYVLEAAEELIARLDPILQGHPDFAAARASLAWEWYARWRGEQRARWLERALSDSKDAYRWSNRTTRALVRAERSAASTPEIAAALDSLRMEYFWDWPGYVPWLPGNAQESLPALRRFADRVLRYAVHEFSVLSWLLEQPKLADRKDALTASMAGRFDGNPGAVQFRANALMAAGDMKAAEDLLRRHVAAGPLGAGPYHSYADLLATQGRHREAFRVIASYPGFAQDSGAGRVELSNIAGQAGWLFWPTGQFEQARPLLKKSADYDTGSAVSLSSSALIALDDGDPDSAARTYKQQARRYSDLEALNSYFELIFALGRPEEAWRTFEEVHRDGNGGKVLAAIAQGARVLGWTDQRTIEWLGSPGNASLADGTFFYAPRAALAASIIDREPVGDLEGVMRSFKAASPYRIDQQTRKIVARPDPAMARSERREICGPSRYDGGPARELTQGDRIDSHLVYFARGYQALDRGQHAQAFSALDEAARLFEFFDNDCENVSYMLPYLALAAAKVKHTSALQEYLRDVPRRDRNVNYNLALAVIAAIDQRHQDAESYLRQARNRWTWYRYHALPAHFVYADILELLYRETEAPLYRDELLRWVRIRQRVQPFEAWPYAKEYQYSRSPANRQRALGMALYLDVESATLRDVSAEEAAAARAAVAAGNPFLAWRKRPAPAHAKEGHSAAN